MKLSIVTIVTLWILMNSCTKPLYQVLVEKVVVETDTVYLYKSTFSEIMPILGKKTDTVLWGDFSYEIFSKKKGISFSFQQSDSLKIIKWANAKVKTNRILIDGKLELSNKTIVKDIVDCFGEGYWSYDSAYNEVILEYDNYDFIVELYPEDSYYLNIFDEYWDDDHYEWFKYNRVYEIEVY